MDLALILGSEISVFRAINPSQSLTSIQEICLSHNPDGRIFCVSLFTRTSADALGNPGTLMQAVPIATRYQ